MCPRCKGVVFQNKHTYENLRFVFNFFLHFGLRETESGFEKQIYTHEKTTNYEVPIQ